MDFFTRLGDRVAALWRQRDCDTQWFPEAATAALREMPPSDNVDALEAIQWVQRSQRLPTQFDLPCQFGQPPITVYSAFPFHIDVLHWVDGTTSIHQHVFSGAFHVLHGSSIHSRYDFRSRHRFNSQLLTGDVRFKSIELLRKGDTRAIEAGNNFIHALFHLDRPSVTVVVRTVHEPASAPQYTYEKPSIAFDPFFKEQTLTRKLQTIDFMRAIEHAGLERTAVDMVRQSTPDTAYYLLDRLFMTMNGGDPFTSILAQVKDAHPKLIEALEPSFEERKRSLNIIVRRRRIKDAEHRFFLALLLNAPDKRHILDLVRTRFPDISPIDKVMSWVAQLAEPGSGGQDNAIDIPLDESSLFILRCLLEGRDFAGVIAKAKEEYAEEDVQEQLPLIEEMTAAFGKSLLFKALLLK